MAKADSVSGSLSKRLLLPPFQRGSDSIRFCSGPARVGCGSNPVWLGSNPVRRRSCWRFVRFGAGWARDRSGWAFGRFGFDSARPRFDPKSIQFCSGSVRIQFGLDAIRFRTISIRSRSDPGATRAGSDPGRFPFDSALVPFAFGRDWEQSACVKFCSDAILLGFDPVWLRCGSGLILSTFWFVWV